MDNILYTPISYFPKFNKFNYLNILNVYRNYSFEIINLSFFVPFMFFGWVGISTNNFDLEFIPSYYFSIYVTFMLFLVTIYNVLIIICFFIKLKIYYNLINKILSFSFLLLVLFFTPFIVCLKYIYNLKQTNFFLNCFIYLGTVVSTIVIIFGIGLVTIVICFIFNCLIKKIKQIILDHFY